MKYYKTRILITILFLYISFPLNAIALEKLVFSSGPQNVETDVAVAILREAYRRIEVVFETEEYPSARSIMLANKGTVDGELFRGGYSRYSTKYPNLIKIPIALTHGEIVVFTKDTFFEVDGWESLVNYSIISILGLVEAERHVGELDIVFAPHAQLIMKQLDHGRCDVVVMPKSIGLLIIEKLGLEGISVLGEPLQRDSIYHYLNVKHSLLAKKITLVLKEMETAGELSAIRTRIESEYL